MLVVVVVVVDLQTIQFSEFGLGKHSCKRQNIGLLLQPHIVKHRKGGDFVADAV